MYFVTSFVGIKSCLYLYPICDFFILEGFLNSMSTTCKFGSIMVFLCFLFKKLCLKTLWGMVCDDVGMQLEALGIEGWANGK